MRSFKLTLSSLALLLLLCVPAPAQSSPTYSQYGIETGEVCPAGTAGDQGDGGTGESVVQSVKDGACAAASNVGQGTDAVNDALADSSSSESASTQSASAGGLASDAPASSVSASGASAFAASASNSAPAGIASGSATGDTAAGSAGADGSGSGSVAFGNPEAAGVASEEGLAPITELPETGGAHPALPIAGALLVAAGLMIRRIPAP